MSKLCSRCKKEKDDCSLCYSMVEVPCGTLPDGTVLMREKPMFASWLCIECSKVVTKGKVEGFSIEGKINKDA